MKTVTIHQAKTNLSKIIQDVINGEEVVIAKGKTPVVKLVLLESARNSQRKLGQLEGKIRISDDFDDELDEFKEYLK